eukprot:752200-Hanusia_phi.AAC.3
MDIKRITVDWRERNRKGMEGREERNNQSQCIVILALATEYRFDKLHLLKVTIVPRRACHELLIMCMGIAHVIWTRER